MPGPAGALLGSVAAKFAPLTPNIAMELLVHCAVTMNIRGNYYRLKDKSRPGSSDHTTRTPLSWGRFGDP